MRLAAHRSRDSERTDARQPANKQSQPFIACGAVTLARDDLGLPILDRDAAQIRDVQAMARHWQVATVTDRERVNWVQQVITHDCRRSARRCDSSLRTVRSSMDQPG